MKKRTSGILSILILVSLLAGCGDNKHTSSSEPIDSIPDDPIIVAERDGLTNTKYRLETDKNLAVGYIGGSITVGAGVDMDREGKSWRGLTNIWLRSTYPNATITDINAAVGATGSYYAKNRIDYDLLDKQPDLIFIEFVVNDNIEGTTLEESRNNMETMVRKCLNANPYTDIVFVYTTTVGLGGNPTNQSRAFDEVAARYGIATINPGEALKNDERPLSELFTSDKTHPNSKGYAVMANEVTSQLEKLLGEADSPTALKAHTLPTMLNPKLSINTHTYRADDILVQNPHLKIGGPVEWSQHQNIEITEGQTLTFTFKGSSIGMYFYTTSVKKNEPLIIKLEDGRVYSRPLYVRHNSIVDEVFKDLDPAVEHTVTLTFSGNNTLFIPYIYTTE